MHDEITLSHMNTLVMAKVSVQAFGTEANPLFLSYILLVCSQYRCEMEEFRSDNVDPLVIQQHNQVKQLKSELECKKMLFSKNCIKISNVVGQGR